MSKTHDNRPDIMVVRPVFCRDPACRESDSLHRHTDLANAEVLRDLNIDPYLPISADHAKTLTDFYQHATLRRTTS